MHLHRPPSSGAAISVLFLIFPPEVPGGRYGVRISTGFTGVPGRPIGRYLLSIALRVHMHAAGADHPEPLALHVNFFSSPPPGSWVEVELFERRKGRSLLFMDAHMT